MTTSRMEAFSDGVIAVIITITVLDLKVPAGPRLGDLRSLAPTFITYLLSFSFVGIYWNNHHNLLAATKKITGTTLWLNLHLLFWLSLTPFTTAWLGGHYTEPWPTAVYSFVALMAGLAYSLLQAGILLVNRDSEIGKRIGRDAKGKYSVLAYVLATAAAFWSHWVSDALIVSVALLWFVPDPRIEDLAAERQEE